MEREDDIRAVCMAVINTPPEFWDNPNGPYESRCVFCDTVHKYGGNEKNPTMADLKHEPNCAYLIAKDLMTGIDTATVPPTAREIFDFKMTWGQKHNEICTALDYPLPHDASDDLLMVDYFWIEKDRMWYPKNSILYSKRDQEIANHLKDSR